MIEAALSSLFSTLGISFPEPLSERLEGLICQLDKEGKKEPNAPQQGIEAIFRCFGRECISQEDVLEDFCRRLPLKEQEEIFESWNRFEHPSELFVEDMALLSLHLQKEGYDELSKELFDFVLKYRLVPSLLLLSKEVSDENSYDLFLNRGKKQIGELRGFLEQFKDFDVPGIQVLRSMLSLQELLLPKSASQKDRLALTSEIKKAVSSFFLQTSKNFTSFNQFSFEKAFFYVCFEKKEGQVSISIFPQKEERKRADGTFVCPGYEISSIFPPQPHPTMFFFIPNEKKGEFFLWSQEEKAYVPARCERKFQASNGWIVKAWGGHQPFPQSKRLFAALPARELLQVFKDVLANLEALSLQNLVPSPMSPDHLWIHEIEGKVHGKIDGFFCQESIDSVESARQCSGRSFVNLLPKCFGEGMSFKQGIWEKVFLEELEKSVSETHLNEVKKLINRASAEETNLSKSLIDYVQALELKGEEGFQIECLLKFAENMAVFPVLAKLAESESFSFEAAKQVLGEAEEVLQSLQQTAAQKRKRTSMRSFGERDVAKICRENSALGNQAIYSTDQENLSRILGTLLQKRPSIGYEERFSKHTVWKGIHVPFSFWVKVFDDHLLLSTFSQRRIRSLGSGGYKKVKLGLETKLFEQSSKTHQIAISRLKDLGGMDTFLKGCRMQEKILQIPGADQFFAPLSQKFSSYQGRRTHKLETVAPYYDRDLYTATMNASLSLSEKISILTSIGKGIELIAAQGISHGDIKLSNIGLTDHKDRGVQAKICDFDLADLFGVSQDKISYAFWNRLRNQYHCISKETDLYGFVLLAAGVLIPKFRKYLQGEDREVSSKIENLSALSEEEARRELLSSSSPEDLVVEGFFPLLWKTLQADRRSIDLAKELLDRGMAQEEALEKALLQAQFPQIEELLSYFASAELLKE